MKALSNLALLFLSLAVLGCATSTPEITPSQVSGPQTWGGATNVTQLRHLYFSDQPDAEALEIAKERGVKVVINLRDPSEHDWDEESAAQNLGLAYYNVPILEDGSFSPAAITQIDDLVAQHSNGEVLLHCSSGNRAAGWLAVHLVAQHGLNEDAALAVAREAGITKDAIGEKVRRYLSEHEN